MAVAPAVRLGVKEDVWIPSVCYMCYNACRIRVHRVDGVITGIEGLPGNPHNNTRVCAKGRSGLMSYYNPGRLTKPLKRTNPQKGLGVDPKFVEISWEEALEITAKKLKEVREKDPRALLFTTFDLHVLGTYIIPWLGAFGSPNFTAGAAGWFCGNGLHPIAWMFHGCFYLEPDWDYTRYALLIGSQTGHGLHLNPMHAGPKVADAKARGLHMTVVDPWLNQAAACAQEWVPIRPGTDGAFAVGILNQLLNELGIYDREFIRKYTNGPYLIGPDGKYVRGSDGKPLMWDPASGKARPFTEAEDFEAAIEGSFEAGGVKCRPGFQILKEHVKSYTPEKVSDITTIPAETIRRIARELGEAASIGSKIVIDGVELPHRPIFVDFSRGALAHKHAMLTGLACQLINVVLGAVDVPGGFMGIVAAGPTWLPDADEDGMLMPALEVTTLGVPNPLPAVPSKIQKLEVKELFPLAVYSRPMIVETINNPEKYKLPYKLEFLLHCRNNFLMNTANPRQMAETFAKIPFQLSFAQTIDETVEFADIVLPDTHYLESLVPLPEMVQCNKVVGEGDWCHAIRQPVIDPEPGTRRNWAEILFELADRAGFLPEFNKLVSEYLGMKGDLALQPDQKYDLEQFVDRFLMAKLGPENGLEAMKEKGFVPEHKPVQAAFPRPFTKGRMPLYAENFVVAGERVKKAVDELGFDFWDLSDYQGVPDWKPCPSHNHKSKEHDLWVINYKMLYNSFSYTAENAWLNELTDKHPHHRGIIINAKTARNKGLSDGDLVWLEDPHGIRVKGRVWLREGIHPEVVATAGIQGHWGMGRPEATRGKGLHFNEFINMNLENLDFLSGALDCCVKAKIYKAS